MRIDACDGAQSEQRARLKIIRGARRGCAVVRRPREGFGAVHGIVEVHAVGDRDFAPDSAQGQRISPVGGDGDVQNIVSRAEDLRRVGAGLRRALGQHDDARVIITQAEFTFGANHSVRDVTVGLASRDGEVTRQR